MPTGNPGIPRGPRGPHKPRPALFVIGPSIAYLDVLHGLFSLVDRDDAIFLQQWNWHAGVGGYVIRRNGYGNLRLHRILSGATQGLLVDHKNLNPLDNRRSNIRICCNGENSMNRRIPSRNKSGVKGVYWHNTYKKWAVQITAYGKILRLGYFSKLDEAAEVRRLAEIQYHGDFARFEDNREVKPRRRSEGAGDLLSNLPDVT